MARGFHVRLSIHDPEWLTPARVLDVAREQSQWLSEIESTKFIPAAVDAAKALMAGVEHGPFFVNMVGVDSFGVHGEVTQVTVSVDTAATEVPGQGPVTAIMSSSTEVEEPAAEPSGEAEVEPQASEAATAAPASVEASDEPGEEPGDEAVDGEA